MRGVMHGQLLDDRERGTSHKAEDLGAFFLDHPEQMDSLKGVYG